jgi:formylglycine-generating enzyme required for sulfatase activity
MFRFIFFVLFTCITPLLNAQKGCCEDCYESGKRALVAKQYVFAEHCFTQGTKCSKKCAYDFMKLIEEVKKAKIENNKRDSLHPPSVKAPFKEPDMVLVQGGAFKMGNSNFEEEKPVHAVMLLNFYIGKYEITQKEWRGVMGADPQHLGFTGCDDCPVERVSWLDIQEFLQKLNTKTGKKYRLPTEAEWEYAARGGTRSKNYKFSGSDTIGVVAWFGSNSGGKTHPVGTKKANELGLYDMTGNVWEWCQDWYDKNYYKTSPAKNPQGPLTGTVRVLRGGSWVNYPTTSRVTFRDINVPTYWNNAAGFRVARSD